MTFFAKSGRLTTPAATGNFAISGLGFQPKAVIFKLGARHIVDVQSTFGVNPSQGFGWGFTAGAGKNCCFFGLGDTTGTHQAYHSATHVIAGKSTASGALQMRGTTVSFDADGFTLNLDIAGFSYNVEYLAVGGSDITGANVFKFDDPAVTGNKAQTGLGFKPTAIIMGSEWANQIDELDGTNTSNRYSLSLLTEAAGTVAQAFGHTNLNVVGAQSCSQRADSAILTLTNTSTTYVNRATLVSFDSDGFTVNFTTNIGSGLMRRWGLALAGTFGAQVVSWTEPSVASTVSVPVAFKPQAGIILSQARAASTSIFSSSGGSANIEAQVSQGLWSNSGDHWSTSITESFTAAGPVLWSSDRINTGTFESMHLTGAAAHSVVSNRNLNSSAYGGANMNYGTVTGLNIQDSALLLGSSAAPPGVGLVRRGKRRRGFAI